MTTTTFAFYDPSHGGIMKVHRTTEPEPPAYRGYPYLVSPIPELGEYRVNVLTLELEAKSEMPIPLDELDPITYVLADGIDEAVFTGIPAGTVVEFETFGAGFQRVVIDDGELILTLDMPQAVNIKFKHPAYHTTWRTVHAY